MEVPIDKHLRGDKKPQGQEALGQIFQNQTTSVSLPVTVLSSAYPVSVHKCAVTAAQLVQWRSLPANHEAALAHCFDDLNRANLSWSFW